MILVAQLGLWLYTFEPISKVTVLVRREGGGERG